MKKIIVLFFSFILIAGSNFSFAQNPVSSDITEVTLFTNKALITRLAQVNVNKGVNEIFLETNAFNLDKDSVQAKVYAKGELFSVQFERQHIKESPQEKVRELELEIEELKEEKTSYLNKKDILDKQEDFLDSLIDFSDRQIPVDLKTSFPKVEDLNKMLIFLNKNFKNILSSKLEINKQIRELDKEINVLQRELNSIRVPSRKVQKGIKIVFNSEKNQNAKIETTYLVYNCSWRPLYKIDVPMDLENTELTMFAKINQKTGENWEDIKLNISNVVPLKGLRLPRLNDWILGGRRRKIKSRSMGAGKVMLDMVREKNMHQEAKQPVANFSQAQKSKLPLSFEYKLSQQLTIESRDKETILPLLSKNVKGKFFYRVVPKTNPLPFLVCKASADEELLNGALNVYFAGRFMGQTYLSEKKAGEEFLLNLGADREVKVKREKIKDKIDEDFFGGVGRKTIIRDLAFKITVENLKDKPIEIKVLDNIPVSRTDKIEVKDVVFEPEPTEIDYKDREGMNLWDLKIDSDKTKEINIKFKVTYPKDMPVYGL